MDFVRAGFTSIQNHVRESLDISEKRNIIASMIAGLLVSSSALQFPNYVELVYL